MKHGSCVWPRNISIVKPFGVLESLKRLEHEYLLRHELDPTWAVRPRGLTREHGRLTLLLDDPGGELNTRFGVNLLRGVKT